MRFLPRSLGMLLLAASAFASCPVWADDPSPGSSEPTAVNLPTDPGTSKIQLPAPPYAIGFDATLASRYIFQGFDYSGASVMQPNFVSSYKNWSATMWSNFQPSTSVFNEFDFTLRYGRTIQKLSVAGGYNYLTYPYREGWHPSQEVLLELGLEAPLSPSFNVHYDYDQGDGAYAQLGVSQSIGPRLSVGSNLFYQHHYYEMTGVPSIEFKASAGLSLGAMALTPALSYFATTDNGTFRGESRLPSTWLFALNVAKQSP
jgi:hypothetical protein